MKRGNSDGDDCAGCLWLDSAAGALHDLSADRVTASKGDRATPPLKTRQVRKVKQVGRKASGNGFQPAQLPYGWYTIT